MTRYPLLEEPLPPGTTTIDGYAEKIGRTASYLRSYWLPRPGFPEPVGELPSPARHGGGRRRKVYTVASLDAFRASQPDLQDHRPAEITTDRDRDERVTLHFFAVHVAGLDPKTVSQYQGNPGFPKAGKDGRYRLGDLLGFFNSRPGKRGPTRAGKRGRAGGRRATAAAGRAA